MRTLQEFVFRRGTWLGATILRGLTGNNYVLDARFNAEHDSSTGAHKTRKISRLVGRYDYNATLGAPYASDGYELVSGTAAMPAVIDCDAMTNGVLEFEFSTPLAHARYDVMFQTQLDFAGTPRPSSASVNLESRTINGFTVYIRDAGGAALGWTTGFTVAIFDA